MAPGAAPRCVQVDYELAPGSLRSAKEIFPASLVRGSPCGRRAPGRQQRQRKDWRQ